MWIDEWLFKNGKEMKDLAEMVGVTRQHMNQITLGTAKASSKLALEIEKATKGNVTTREILYGTIPKRGGNDGK